jgi:hypothetical protein
MALETNLLKLINDIVAEIKGITEALKNKNLDAYAKDVLVSKKEKLQQQLNELLKDRNIISETEADKIFEQLRLEKKGELEALLNKNKLTLPLIAVGVVVLLYLALKKKK